ncbi:MULTISPECIES: hypothetical protein [Sinorhizobium]|uniref:Uncharacterized protein n=1 Tax=Rhizobium meliloti TaxID=382 RepID=A0A2J0Z8N2_RHIML|nr:MULTISPECIES: hypothetical protein [Sinorhizobium]GCA48625.1 hypothetical protein KGO5_01057 [Sinorhizobium sp. KGO-5]PJR16874.1 hypothetical protein CEJ86_01370 [Sinorhizobium meliloti]WEJ10692.1 hypothetical protein N0Q90_05845 [Sinorhizobium sp. M103]WEJ14730.1 hypothetical protein N0Q91_14475 [Sinorhizobium sp. K101]WEJ37668.1 hypothetical protein N0R80_05820 [Sinorhizobium sp. C101]
MDMMAMALLFDMASRNRPWDERFEPPPQSRRRPFAKRLLAAVFRKRQPAETSDGCGGSFTVSCAGGAK